MPWINLYNDRLRLTDLLKSRGISVFRGERI